MTELMPLDDTQPNQPFVLTELREILKSGEEINDQTYKRMNLALIAEIYDRQRALERKIETHTHVTLPHPHTEMQDEIDRLKKRDWMGFGGAAILSVLGLVVAKVVK